MFSAHHTCWSRRLLLRESKNMLDAVASLSKLSSLRNETSFSTPPWKTWMDFTISFKPSSSAMVNLPKIFTSPTSDTHTFADDDQTCQWLPSCVCYTVWHPRDWSNGCEVVVNDVVEWWNHLDSHHIWQCGYVLILLLSSQTSYQLMCENQRNKSSVAKFLCLSIFQEEPFKSIQLVEGLQKIKHWKLRMSQHISN